MASSVPCAVVPIIHPTSHDLDVISEQLEEQLLSYNATIESNCK